MNELHEVFSAIVDPEHELNLGDLDPYYVMDFAFDSLRIGISKEESEHVETKIRQYMAWGSEKGRISYDDYMREFTAYFEDIYSCEHCGKTFRSADICDDRPDDFPVCLCERCYKEAKEQAEVEENLHD